MKLTIPSKTVEACDLCKCTGYHLDKCVTCGCEYCHTCEAIMCGCIHQPKLCKRCAEIEGVVMVVERFAPLLTALLKKRDKALRLQRPQL